MGKILDLIGQTFGKLTVLEKTRKNNRVAWICQCECGNQTTVITNSLTSGNTKSCGCGINRPDETGKIYGFLTVINKAPTKNGKAYWNCRCRCGKETIVSGDALRRGQSISCGCSKIIDEIDNTYGLLTVEQFAYIENHNAYWICKCKCGNLVTIAGSHLRSGHTQSCGCAKSVGEYKINQILSQNNIFYQSQYAVLVDDSYLRFDFALLDENNQPIKFIEYDGEFHYPNSPHPWESYENIHRRDLLKNEYCKTNNIPLVRIPYWERDNLNLDLIVSDKYLI